MVNKAPVLNTRILVIDDEESVRDSFAQALCPETRSHDSLKRAAVKLFGPVPDKSANRPYANMQFVVDFAVNGRQGYDKVCAAINDEHPYAAVFVDMRMPGWDGAETVEHVRAIDRRCEVIFVTAYADYSVDTLVMRAGANVGYALKPFSLDEIKQMATKAVINWNKAREMERFMQTLVILSGRTADIEEILQYLLGQLCLWLGTDSAALIQQSGNGQPKLHLGRGALRDEEAVLQALGNASALPEGEPIVANGCVILPIQNFGAAVAMSDSTLMTPDRVYLLRAFVEHAALALQNSQARAMLERAQKMSAMGEALSFVLHDLRGPLGNAQMLIEQLWAGDEMLFPRDEMFQITTLCLGQVDELVNSTLDYVRGNVQPVKVLTNLRDSFARPLKSIELELQRRNVALHIDMPDGIRAHIDTHLLSRALRNLAMNAADAAIGREQPRVAIGVDSRDGQVHLWVEDNGRGIPSEIRDRLFEPFVTAGKSRGVGLGLAMVKLAVDAHDGSIDVRTGADGTRFDIRIPAT